MKICKYCELGDPKLAGAMTMEVLEGLLQKYPDLIPCGERLWNWVYRETCQHCDRGQYKPPKKKT